MSESERSALLRERAQRMAGWTDRQIDKELIYIDSDQRDQVKLYVNEYRRIAAAADPNVTTKPSGRLLATDGPRPPRGRPPLTNEQVGADLDRALSRLAVDRQITRPTWEQLAGAHDGLDWDGMSVDNLRKRRKKHPAPFAEKVPHLTKE